jgi:ribonuclease E
LEGTLFPMSHDNQPFDAAPEAQPSSAPAFAPLDDANDHGPDGSVADRNSRRRRGSRGGKKRRRPSEVGAEGGGGEGGGEGGAVEGNVDRAEYERRPADLPDSPFEGVPDRFDALDSRDVGEPRAVGEANEDPPSRRETTATRPQIGDSRRLPVTNNESSAAPGDSNNATEAQRGPRQNRSRNRNSRSGRSGRSEGNDLEANARANGSANTAAAAPATERPRRDRTLDIDATSDTQTNTQTNTQSDADPARRSKRRRRSGAERGDGGGFEVTARRAGTERNGRPTGRYLMCVHTRPKATQIAVLEGRSLIEHYVSRPTDSVGQIHGNIYLGRVQNVLPGMEAAFVDIGTPKNAVLYRADLQLDAEFDADASSSGGRGRKSDARIEQLLKNGQMVLCQVTKNPIGSKGARLTQEVSIPGRFVVFIPNSDTYGISKRLPDDERRRLRSVLDTVKPAGHGLIVRTAAEGASADELRRDVQLLVKQWERIDANAKKSSTPTLLHKEPDITVRVIREEFNRNYRGVVIDNRELFEEIREYVASITPELADRVEFHDPETEPLPVFEKNHVHEQLHKAIDRKVWLPSGGSLIIERTEALTVIDVNTGKNVGSSSLEETVFKNNLEAADEIARQLRLRDIGGIIVIDFIDMETRSNREAVVTSFRSALSRDKTRTQVFDISELGLVEMTRKRISEGLVESLSDTCPTCDGRGFVYDNDLIGD